MPQQAFRKIVVGGDRRALHSLWLALKVKPLRGSEGAEEKTNAKNWPFFRSEFVVN